MKRRNGFTFLELIIGLVLMGLVCFIFAMVMGNWEPVKVFCNRPLGEIKVVEFFAIVLLMFIFFK
jgi:hypothetical protein